MTSQPSLQITVIHILPNILRSKDNQTMKFGQLIKWTWETFFLKNYAQMGAEASPRPFSEKLKWSISLDQ